MMSTVEEVTTAARQVAAHEALFAILGVRIDEMRDHLDHAGLLLHAAEAQMSAGGNTSGHVNFTLSKEMMTDSFNGADRRKLSDWGLKMSVTTSTRETSWCGPRRNRKTLPRTSLTRPQLRWDVLDKHEVTQGFQGTCSLGWTITQMGHLID